MMAGPLMHPVAFELPDGIDGDLNLHFVSDSTGMEARITIAGVTGFASNEHMLVEVKNMLGDQQFLEIARDWRLMTKAETLDYRKRQQEEVRLADRHRQEGERAGASPS